MSFKPEMQDEFSELKENLEGWSDSDIINEMIEEEAGSESHPGARSRYRRAPDFRTHGA